MTRARLVLSAAALALVAFIGAWVATNATDSAPTAGQQPSAAAARTSFPGLQPAAAEPTLTGLDQLAPAPGSVVQAPGPFDDRFRLENLTLDAAGVHGSARVVSDVSTLLELEALAGFYDADGRLLGTGRFVHHLDESHGDHAEDSTVPDEVQDFVIPLPAGLPGTAVSAAVGVPVLVNE